MSSKKIGYSHSTSSNLYDLEVLLNGYLLPPNTIIDLQIDFGRPSKIGNITFSDLSGISELSTINSGSIKISYKDFNEHLYSESFEILTVTKNEDKSNKPVFQCKFEDQSTSILKSTYLNLHFADMSAIQILNEITKTLDLDYYLMDVAKPVKFENVVTPSHISLWEWIQTFIKQHNILMFCDKHLSYIIHSDLADFSGLGYALEDVYSVEDKGSSYRRITEYNTKLMDRNALAFLPNRNEYVFDENNS
ncbi:MAG: hypothetical protein J7L63_04945, partial [Thermoplasmata archaeon]|nr:hypothetical protein [Thermoplasmata archaeon]